ncbi:helix-turn-helix domain-containing protein [Pedobacter immunditicola]|uniref:helix-turn-helix domain-containing protein n=1 Tax=Pedobacter immunditicola TaxID=3133440 RepID=UPI0030974665
MMNYLQIAPPEHLKAYIRYIWTWQGSTHTQNFKIIADGCPGLIFQKSDRRSFYQNGKLASSFFVYGQATKYAEVSFSESITIGVCFRPNALKSIFGIDAFELTDTCMDLDDFVGEDGDFLYEQLVHNNSVQAQITLLLSFLESQIQQNAAAIDQQIAYVIETMIRSKGTVTLKSLESNLQVSQRTLERRFKQQIGLSPINFLRICRFQASLNQLKHKTYKKLSDVAYNYGYADQSHYIRSFKEFAGLSPFKFQDSSNNFSQVFPLLKI